MQIDIKSTGFSVADSFVQYSRQELLSALAYCSGHVRRVVVKLSDIDASSGYAHKRCQIQVMLAGVPDVVIEDSQTDLHAAFERAVARTKRTVVRKIDYLLSPRCGSQSLDACETLNMRGAGRMTMTA